MANLVEYVKTVWENGKTALNAARMNNMENGISNCATQINRLGDSVSRGSQVAYTADSGTAVIDTAGWENGLYYLVGAADYQKTAIMLDGMVVKNQSKEIFASAMHGTIEVSGSKITVTSGSYYTRVFAYRVVAL